MDFSLRVDPADETAMELLGRLAQRAEVTPMVHGRGTALVLGGARSGKSSWAEAQLAGAADVEYVATSEVLDGDAEWAERVALHVARLRLALYLGLDVTGTHGVHANAVLGEL